MKLSQRYCSFGYGVIDSDDRKAGQESARSVCHLRLGTDENLHPGDNADRLFAISCQFVSRWWNCVEIIDQDICVEKRLYHSLRMFS